MAKDPKAYLVLENPTKAQTRDMVSFPVLRLPVFCEHKGQRIALEREAILRGDTLDPYETLSSGYSFIPHLSALDAMEQALEGYKARLVRLSLEQNGAAMAARYRLTEKSQKIGEEEVSPEIVLLNSYNGSTALGVNLETFHSRNKTHASTNFRVRWMHLGNEANAGEIKKAVESALRHFEEKTIVFYQKLLRNSLSSKATVGMAIVATIRGVLSKKLGKRTISRIVSHSAKNAWDLMNAFLYPIHHDFECTPDRKIELQMKILYVFNDAGNQLLTASKQIKEEDLREWTTKVAA